MRFSLIAAAVLFCAGASWQEQRRVVPSREFTLTLTTTERVITGIAWVSRDGGRTWSKARDAGIGTTWGSWREGEIRCTVVVPEEGAYDFYLQFNDAHGNLSPEPRQGDPAPVNLRFLVRAEAGRSDLVWESPQGAKEWTGGIPVTLKWRLLSGDVMARSVELEYAIGSGAWVAITRGLEPSGSYLWVVPNRDTRELRLRVRALTAEGEETSAVSTPVSVRAVPRPDVATARALYDRARILAAQLRRTEAVEKYEGALAAWPEFPEALNDLGRLYAQRGEDAKSLEYFLRARRACPSNPMTYVNAALAQLRLGLNDDALADLRDALALGVDRNERAAVLAGETLWRIAAAAKKKDEDQKALLACGMILKIRRAARPTRERAARLFRALSPEE